MESFSPLSLVGFLWLVITVILLAIVIYRAVVGIHEENQIFLDSAEAALEKEQVETLKRIHVLDGYIKGLGIASGVLLLILASMWVYQGIYGPPS